MIKNIVQSDVSNNITDEHKLTNDDIVDHRAPSIPNSTTVSNFDNVPKHTQPKTIEKPKINITAKDSLFLLNYSNIPPSQKSNSDVSLRTDKIQSIHVDEFAAFIYIDIPIVDYYNYKMDNNHEFNGNININKIVKKVKINKIKDLIMNAVINNNKGLWDKIKETSKNKEVKVDIKIYSSGSLIYVETIKYVMETIYNNLMTPKRTDSIKLQFHVEVSTISLKWLNSFIDNQHLLGRIKFINKNPGILHHKNYNNPFKDYFILLNDRYVNYDRNNINLHNTQAYTKLESIIVITNNTGIKALLTILSDKPLVKLISQESLAYLDEFEKNNLTEKQTDDIESANTNGTTIIGSPRLRREPSSIMSLQNSMLTSNKGKSVRIRSLSINKNKLNDKNNICQMVDGVKNLNLENSSFNDPDFYSFSDSDEDNSSSDDESGDMLSIVIPTKLSRTNSEMNMHNKLYSKTANRFRSLSLIDQNHGKHNRNFGDNNNNTVLKKNNTSVNLKQYKHYPSIVSTMEPLKLVDSRNSTDSSYTTTDITDEEDIDLDEVYPVGYKSRRDSETDILTENNHSNIGNEKKFSNIYVHDGDFNDIILYPSSISKKKKRRKTLTNGIDDGTVNVNAGLIPPEFYSRISTPASSRTNSNVSITNMTYVIPQKITGVDQSNNCNDRIFEKNLIKKSFEEVRSQNSMTNLFETLIGGYNYETDNDPNHNPLALNFKSKAKRQNNFPNFSSLSSRQDDIAEADEEDMMMSGITEKINDETGYIGPEPVGSTEQRKSTVVDNTDLNNYLLGKEISNDNQIKPINKIQSTGGSLSFNLSFNRDNSGNADFKSDSSSIATQPNSGINFGLSLYDEDSDSNETITLDTLNGGSNSRQFEKVNNNANYKKVFTVDLYGDDDVGNSDAWCFGNNK
ncbi:hypothetical protein TPHA_0L00900 [Tetrapisispora phaffii CBS 4417]|uniref:Uncharacterized protein n=1 Tax=Tetrapisispora phaffii (strain ATCC 24235 / CBS 4417 / NBRC 1672 / NRRL Y-8282 / UCD 70-5) TaxID=1071381 RepID=G8BZW9_TETPH|nr:hypothetical protein TPHA_0L00900 [Tetrapisispora phaffii CBS 4417]CCE65447.1 hypothetical protein TPHA_0L00900 [Tetrapisispora phaffii CBS 4417]